jgi:hypothetical protein
MAGITAAGWAAIGSAAVGAGTAVYSVTNQPKAPKPIAAPPVAKASEDEVSAARERRRAGLGGGLASTILSSGASPSGQGKQLLGM